MLGTIVFHIVSNWCSDELNGMRDGETPHLALRVSSERFSLSVVWAWRTNRMDFV